MSASAFYRQVNPLAKTHLPCWAGSHFASVMEKVFGEYPWRLDVANIATLQGMQAASHDGAGDGEPYRSIIRAIEDLGTIEVWVEY